MIGRPDVDWSIALPGAPAISRPFVDRLHEWVTTVDHKRLGILYIGYALVFLVHRRD